MTYAFARFDQAITEYVAYCQGAGLAQSTVRRYESDLRRLQRDAITPRFGSNPVLRSLPVNVWRDWIMTTYGKCAPKTFNRNLSAVRAFINWCYDEDKLDRSKKHLRGIRDRANEATIDRQWVEEKELPALMAAAERWHKRDAILVACEFYLIRRGGEIANLRIRDVDLRAYPDAPHGRVAYHNQKGKRHRVIVISPVLRAILDEWLMHYAALVQADGGPAALHPDMYLVPALKPASGALTVAGTRRLMTVDPYKRIGDYSAVVTKALRAAGMYSPGNSGHALRRGGARALYEKASAAGHPNALRLCMIALDHRSESQTETYLGYRKDDAELGRILTEVFAVPPTESTDAPTSPTSEADDLMSDIAGLLATRRTPGKRVA